MQRFFQAAVVLVGLATSALADAAGDERVRKQLTADITIRLYGDTAVVTGRSGIASDDASNAINGETRWTRVFVRQGGTWKIGDFYATLVRK